jgi:predicted HicB family RNase H-like nuclease
MTSVKKKSDSLPLPLSKSMRQQLEILAGREGGPINRNKKSKSLPLHLSQGMRRQLRTLAEREGVSIDQLICIALTEKIIRPGQPTRKKKAPRKATKVEIEESVVHVELSPQLQRALEEAARASSYSEPDFLLEAITEALARRSRQKQK